MKKIKTTRNVKSRYTKYKIKKLRVARLREELLFYEEAGDASKIDALIIIEKLKWYISELQNDMQAFYDVIKELHDEAKIYIAELRYMDGKSWSEISSATGLSMPTLYLYNKEIKALFNKKGKSDILC